MEKTITEARRRYLEEYASVIVTNNYLKVSVLVLSAVLLGMLILTFQVFSWANGKPPLVVRIDEVGRATAVNYSGSSYRPEAPEIRYFLGQFVQLYFSRLIGSVNERFGKSLFFLDQKLSQAVIEEERKNHAIADFVREGAEEIDIEIKNIVLHDLRLTPMKASVDFEKIYFPRGERREIRRERFAGSFEFVVQGSVPTSFVLVNPLGLTMTYFRVDAAFK